MLGIYMDISKLRQAEGEVLRYQQELSHIARLGTMGEMASGMAHELNQPLTALVSYCGTAISLLKTLSSPPRITSYNVCYTKLLRYIQGKL